MFTKYWLQIPKWQRAVGAVVGGVVIGVALNKPMPKQYETPLLVLGVVALFPWAYVKGVEWNQEYVRVHNDVPAETNATKQSAKDEVLN